MEYKYFSHNGNILSIEEAVVPISNIEYSYGFGVYETIRVTNRIPYFLKDHLERLAESARIIELDHSFSRDFIEQAIAELIKKNEVVTCNIKLLLIGGSSQKDASLYILCLNPMFIDKKLYRDGVRCITYKHERPFPHAKTLNMLSSYLAYQKAKIAGAYEALLLNRNGFIIEGTRTNFFCIKGKSIISPPESDILPGVTRKVLMKVAAKNGYTFEEKMVTPEDLALYDGSFLTSTSSKILPVNSIDETTFPDIPTTLRELMTLFDAYLKDTQAM